MSAIQPLDASGDFLAGVEHGRGMSAMDVIALRLTLEGETRKRVRASVLAERRRGALHSRRRVMWTILLTALVVYNVTKNGIGFPW